MLGENDLSVLYSISPINYLTPRVSPHSYWTFKKPIIHIQKKKKKKKISFKKNRIIELLRIRKNETINQWSQSTVLK